MRHIALQKRQLKVRHTIETQITCHTIKVLLLGTQVLVEARRTIHIGAELLPTPYLMRGSLPHMLKGTVVPGF